MSIVRIRANPHPGQKAVHESLARFKVLAAGRRWGKTRLGVNECLDVAAQGGRAWWVAPSYKMSEVGWRAIRRIGVAIPGTEVSKVDRSITLVTGGQISVRSADNPDSLRGDGLDFIVLDEVAFMKEEAWSEALRPALADRQGRALFISTPKGRNWFWRLWLRGQEEGNWQSWQFPTESNPHIDRDEIEEARRTLPERIFRQEFLAEFIEDSAGVFRRVNEAAVVEWENGAIGGREYVIGVDWGKYNDFTVFAVINVTSQALVYLDRFNQIDYQVQIGRLQALVERFKPKLIVVERNSIGEPLVEQLQRDRLFGDRVKPFQTTGASKAKVIDALALAFERGELRIVPDEVLLAELQAFEMARLSSGTFRYSAPPGMHDDTVIALALAWNGAQQISHQEYVWSVQ